MFNSKSKVDKHVATLLQKQKTESERKKAGFQIADLYVKINEFPLAARYLDSYIAANPDFYKAHNLRGKIYEHTNQISRAVECYKRSLDLNLEQKNVLVKICELLCGTDIDPERLRYWYERLEKVHPNHEILMQLQERICTTGDLDENQKELEQLYVAELKKRPRDVQAHIKLLQLYVKQDRVNEAYTHATQEEELGVHDQSVEWFRCLLDIYKEYKEESKGDLNGSFHTNLLWAECQLLLLNLEKAKVVDAVEALISFDQTLHNAGRLACPKPQWTVFLQEMQAQLYFLSGVLVLKKAKERGHEWKGATLQATACFLASYSVQEPNRKAAWFAQAKDDEKRTYDRWFNTACYRCSQSGHLLRILSRGQDPEWFNRIQEEICNDQGKQKLFESLFCHGKMRSNEDESYMCNNVQFTTFNPRIPESSDLLKLDQVVDRIRPKSLDHILWRVLQYRTNRENVQPDYQVQIFENLQYGNVKLDAALPSSLSKLDIEAFLYAAVIDYIGRSQVALSEPHVPEMLPLAICDPLSTPEQSKWWTAVYQLLNNTNRQQQSELHRILQFGLEKIRLIGSHGLDSNTLIQLARTFAQRLEDHRTQEEQTASVSDIVEEQNALQARMEHYWSGAVVTLDKLRSKKNINLPKPALFTNHDGELLEEEYDKLLAEARYNLGLVAKEAGDLERAIKELEQVNWPEAAFEQGQCFKQLADQEANKSLESMGDDERTQQVALLQRAKRCFENVTEQLPGEHRNQFYSRSLDELEELNRILERLDFGDQSVYAESLLESSVAGPSYLAGTPLRPASRSTNPLNQSRAFAMSTPRAARSFAKPSSGPSSLRVASTHATPRRSPQPSPERLDIQMKIAQRSQKELLDEHRKSRKQIQKLEQRIDEMESTAPKAHEYEQIFKQNSEMLQEVRDLSSKMQAREMLIESMKGDIKAQQDSIRRLLETEAELKISVKMFQRQFDDQLKIREELEQKLRVQDEAHTKDLANIQSQLQAQVQAHTQALAQVQAQAQAQAQAQFQAAPMMVPPNPQAQVGISPHLQPQTAQIMNPAAMSAMYNSQTRPPRAVVSPYATTYGAYDYQNLYGLSSYMGQYPNIPPGTQYGVQQPPSHGPQRSTKIHHGTGGAGEQRVTPEEYDEDENGYYDEDEEGPDGEEYIGQQSTTDPNQPVQVPDSQLVHQWPNGNAVHIEGKSRSTVAYSPQRAAMAGQNAYMTMSPSHGQMPPGYSPTGHRMPGPGFFSAQTPNMADTMMMRQKQPNLVVPSGAGQQPGMVPANQGYVMPQGVSPAAMSGADLFKLPSPQVSYATSFPLSMPAGSTPNTSTFAGVRSPKGEVQSPGFKPTSPTKLGPGEESEGDTPADDSYTGPDFKPLVSLPEVQTQSGEENESVMFEHRAKLFRFIEGQWKERGLGQIKILQHKESKVVRVLMRRDQVLKVCANHRIKADMDISFKSPDDKKVLTWRAMDGTEEEPRLEQFCCKFKTPEIAADFKETFEKAKKIVPAQTTSSPAKSADSTVTFTSDKPVDLTDKISTSTPVQTAEDARPTILSPPKFSITGLAPEAPKPSAFTFGASKVTPATDMLKAFAAKADDKSTKDATSTFGGFTFSSPPIIKSTEDSEQKTNETKSAKDPDSQQVAKPFSNLSFTSQPTFGSLSFGTPKQTTTKPQEPPKSTAPSFGNTMPGGQTSFASLAQSGTSKGFGDKDTNRPFAGSGQPVFKTKSPGKGAGEPHDDEHVEEYEPDVDFKPIVSLPDQVELTTGEEDEEKLFGHRAKLYRHDTESKQWKERGTGEIKIMKNLKTGTYRILMRREQVHKTCANHLITKDMKLVPMQTSENCWCWFAHDFTEDEMKAEQFAVRFKPKDQAQRFKDVFDECIAKAGDVTEKKAGAVKPKPIEEQGPVSLAEQFKVKVGEWDCDACYVRNKGDSKRCVACQTLKPGETDDEPEISSTTVVPAPKFGEKGGIVFEGFSAGAKLTEGQAPSSLAEQFKVKVGEWDCDTCYVRNKGDSKRCVACQTLKPGETDDEPEVSSTTVVPAPKFGEKGGFVFEGIPAGTPMGFGKTSEAVASTPPASAGFQFAGGFQAQTAPATTSATTGGFQFGGLAQSTPTTAAVTSTTGGFGSSSGAGFGAGSFAFGNSPFSTPKKEENKETVPKPTDKPKLQLPKTDSPFSFGKDGGFSFTGVTPTKKTEKPRTPKTPTSPEDGDYYVNKEGEDDHIYFAPVVKLPEKVELKTGEEEEDLLFCHRGKLYRFTQNEWKERGVGNVKILRNKETMKARILMRREHVLKLCMNHAITKDLKLNPMPNANGKAWVWHAADFAEEDQSHEQFALRFGTEEASNNFKSHFESARDDPSSMPAIEPVLDKSPEKKSKPRSDSYRKKSESKDTEKKEETEKAESKTDAFSSFSFKSPEATKPSASEIPKPKHTGFNFASAATFGESKPVFGSGAASTSSLFKSLGSADDGTKAGGGLLAQLLAEPAKEGALNLSKSASASSADSDVVIMKEETVPKDKVQAARKWKLPDAFYMYESRPDCTGCLGCQSEDFDFSTIGSQKTVQVSKEQEAAPEKDVAVPKVEELKKKVAEADSTTSSSLSLFGNSNLTSSFGDLASLASGKSEEFAFKKSDSFTWDGKGKSVFGAAIKGQDGDEDDEDKVSESPDVHFEPIVQLPEVVDLKTGEEEDEKVFSQRAKLFRYADGQWKERGVGEMKILKNKETGRVRLLMRREQVLKVACNHYLTPEMTLKPLQTSETAWCWYAVDHAENKPKDEQFALKFKTKDQASLFKEKFDECREFVALAAEKADKTLTEQEEAETSNDDSNGEEITVLFSKRATLFYLEEGAPKQVGMGELQVLYDDDVYGGRVQMKTDKEQLICNHIVCRRYVLNINEKMKCCEWTAKDFSTDEPIRRHFRAQFSSANAVGEFKEVFQQGLTWATESEIDEVTDGTSVTGELTVPQVASASSK